MLKSNHSHEKFIAGRRSFMVGALAAGAVGLTSCTEPQVVRVNPVSSPTPGATPAATPSNPLPPMPPYQAKTYPATYKNAVLASDEIVNHFAKSFDTPSALIHAVRGYGKNFKRADGSNALDFLCGRFAEEKNVNGTNFVRFTRSNVEVHENSFLKTFLEAGVSPDQVITVNGKKYTLKDLGEHAKSLFRLDPNNLTKFEKDYTQEHLPWGLIAFSNLLPGGKGSWVNAYGEKIELLDVIDKSLAEFEGVCQSVKSSLDKHEEISAGFHTAIKPYACYGNHAVYGFLSCLKNGYTERGLKERIPALLNLTIYRLAKQTDNIEREYAEELATVKADTSPQIAQMNKKLAGAGVSIDETFEMVKLRAIIKLTGHILEAVNFAKLNKIFNPTPEQQKYLQTGEQKLIESIVKMRALNLEGLKNFEPKPVGEVVIGMGHASRALKLLTPENPDKNPKSI